MGDAALPILERTYRGDIIGWVRLTHPGVHALLLMKSAPDPRLNSIWAKVPQGESAFLGFG